MKMLVAMWQWQVVLTSTQSRGPLAVAHRHPLHHQLTTYSPSVPSSYTMNTRYVDVPPDLSISTILKLRCSTPESVNLQISDLNLTLTLIRTRT